MLGNFDQEYWNNKWEKSQTGWDIGHASTAMSEYFSQLENKAIKILIPGCGNAHEAEMLLEEGFKNITLMDIAPKACELISKKFPSGEVEVLCENFFGHVGKYDLIVEQTFFCALAPSLRREYVKKTHELLTENGKVVGLLFDKNFGEATPPFGGTEEEYRKLFEDKFEIRTLERCYNSIKPRENAELFINFCKK